MGLWTVGVWIGADEAVTAGAADIFYVLGLLLMLWT